MCVSNSGAFRRQTAAETQTGVASRGFVEVCLGSLTSQLVCYCSGKLCIQGTLCLTEPPALSVFLDPFRQVTGLCTE